MVGKILGRALGSLLAAGLMLALPAPAQPLTPLPPQPEGLAWPGKGWERAPLPEESREAVEALIAEAMGKTRTDVMGMTRSLVIIHRGRLVAEAYAEGFMPETRQVSWSMAKSITQALAGRAVQLGLIADIDAPMPSPFKPGDPRREISWRHWLNAVDGLDYREIGGDPSPVRNDVIRLMYGGGRMDVAAFIEAEFPLRYTPGTYWNYSTPAFHLASWALQGAAGFPADRRFTAWMQNVLFEPIGMQAVPEFDAAGTYLGGSLVWASAHDFAKFGYLYLRDGVWGGERLLPEGWVDFARSPGPSENANIYGAGWWIIPPEGPLTHNQNADSEPRDAFHAGGHEGQTIWVVPSRDLVIVRLGLMPNGGDNWPTLWEWNQRVARSFPEAAAD